jgi:tetratricopeptide (TPR) repeat protein
MGLALSKMGHQEKAVGYFEAALRADPSSYFLHYYLGVNLLELGRREEAVRHLKRALVLAEPFKEEFLISNLRNLIERFDQARPNSLK